MINWATKRYLLLALVALAACAAVVALLLAGRRGGKQGESREGETSPEVQEEQGSSDAEAGGSGSEEAAGGGGAFSVIPGTGEGGPAMIISFPNPLSWEESVPGTEDSGVCGRWVLEMEGAPFALRNCHLLLDEHGDLSLPPDYGSLLQMKEGIYTWDAANGSFRAHVVLVVKAAFGTGQGEVPLQVILEGTVSASLHEITGSYQAVPGGEAYTPYAQQGGFLMRRLSATSP